jgi:hypothetical protein
VHTLTDRSRRRFNDQMVVTLTFHQRRFMWALVTLSTLSCGGWSTHGNEPLRCTGTPYVQNCGQCLTDFGCTQCPGCTPVPPTTPPTCSGTPISDCATCEAKLGNCSSCVGCAVASAAQCAGSPLACSGWGPGDCEANGCQYDAGPQVGFGVCSGTPTPCDNFADAAACTILPGFGRGCLWTACSGTLTPCDQLASDPATCRAQSGCRWVVPPVSCEGTPTPCEQLDAATCTAQWGCGLL